MLRSGPGRSVLQIFKHLIQLDCASSASAECKREVDVSRSLCSLDSACLAPRLSPAESKTTAWKKQFHRFASTAIMSRLVILSLATRWTGASQMKRHVSRTKARYPPLPEFEQAASAMVCGGHPHKKLSAARQADRKRVSRQHQKASATEACTKFRPAKLLFFGDGLQRFVGTARSN